MIKIMTDFKWLWIFKTNQPKQSHNSDCSYIPLHPCRVLSIAGLGSGIINVLLKLVKDQQPDIDKIN